MARGCRTARSVRRLTAAVALSGGAALLLSACSNSGTALAQKACVHVDASIRLYTEAQHETDVATARRKANEAVTQLEDALQFAAQATSSNPAFNPLMTTLQEIGRTTESNLIPALRAQCAAATSATAGSTPVG